MKKMNATKATAAMSLFLQKGAWSVSLYRVALSASQFVVAAENGRPTIILAFRARRLNRKLNLLVRDAQVAVKQQKTGLRKLSPSNPADGGLQHAIHALTALHSTLENILQCTRERGLWNDPGLASDLIQLKLSSNRINELRDWLQELIDLEAVSSAFARAKVPFAGQVYGENGNEMIVAPGDPIS